MSDRRRRNAISFIAVGTHMVEGVAYVREAMFGHFQSHILAQNINRPRVDDLQFRQLYAADATILTSSFHKDEVKAAIWDCDGYKSPGLDGILLGFFKDFLPELKSDIMQFVSEFHRNSRLSKGINSTFIALIPKIDNPQRLHDFRPIALVSCLYKILAQLLVKRLMQVMGKVVSETQSDFVKDRQILNDILITNEVVDEARMMKKQMLMFKVDFEKAFDSVDWDIWMLLWGE